MKYMGSKSKVAKYIVPIIQSYIDTNNITTYCEPFVGGGNVIDKIKCQTKIGIDANPYLIALLNKAVKNPNTLYEKVSRELYNKARNEYKTNIVSFEDWQIGNIGFLASYNGKFFGGYAGVVHTKTDTVRDYYDESRRNLVNQSENLQDIIFKCADYTSCQELKKSVVYCDPPYKGTTKYSASIDYDAFWDFCRELSENNIVLVSEHNAPNDFIPIWQQEVIRTLDNKQRKKSIEKLFIRSDYGNNS